MFFYYLYNIYIYIINSYNKYIINNNFPKIYLKKKMTEEMEILNEDEKLLSIKGKKLSKLFIIIFFINNINIIEI